MSFQTGTRRVGEWWIHGGKQDLRRLWLRAATGCIAGALVGVALLFLERNRWLYLTVPQEWVDFATRKRPGNVGPYRHGLFLLCTGAAALVVPWLSGWLHRYIRSWWAGISSAMLYLTATAVAGLVHYEISPLSVQGGSGLVLLLTVSAVELWRRRTGAAEIRLSPEALSIDHPDEPRWTGAVSDGAISEWSEDVIGRAAVVELIADYVLRQRVQVIALHGGLGDGKTSVLNLLRRALGGRAITVPFSAWLPASEAALAQELFNDIAAECRRYVHVPQLHRKSARFARMIGGSVAHLSVLKEIIPTPSQQEEIEELCNVLSRIPRPVVVLLDEIDRMQREEILVLLKILRGAASIRNVSFVCAFSREDVERQFDNVSSDYMEKFFPVTVKLSAPDPRIVRRLLLPLLRGRLQAQKWFWNDSEAGAFEKLIDESWEHCFQPLCTNLRKAGRLLNHVEAAGRPIAGDANPFDLVAVETIRLFFPKIYSIITGGLNHLTSGLEDPLSGARSNSGVFFSNLNAAIDEAGEPGSARRLLSLMFPEYAKCCGDQSIQVIADNSRKDDRGRICDPDYFWVYLRSSIPEEMFSDSELVRVLERLTGAQTEAEAASVFNAVMDEVPAGSAKRRDFMWKLSRQIDQLTDTTVEHLARAVAARSFDYQFDLWLGSELAHGVNIVLRIAQKLAATPAVQRTLEASIILAPDDTFAEKILFFVDNPSRNELLTDFSNIDVPALGAAFVRRMRGRYRSSSRFDWAQSDWNALRRWTGNSKEDRLQFREFVLARVGSSRKELARVINVIYPAAYVWADSPEVMVDKILPIMEVEALLSSLPPEDMSDAEREGIERFKRLMKGTYPTRAGLSAP